MAQLAAGWTREQLLGQYGAIARLRWRMALNQSRRPGGEHELAGKILLGLLYSVFAVVLTGMAFAAGFFLAKAEALQHLWIAFWCVFGLCQLLNLQLGQPGTTFDPAELIRFPLRLPNYVAIRLFFNLLSPANVVGTAMSLALALGLTLAQPRLWWVAFSMCIVFAITNVLFSRMVFAWVDRWLSTRRAREVFTALVFTASLGFQYLNFTFNPAYGHRRLGGSRITPDFIYSVARVAARVRPWLYLLPPTLAGDGLRAGAAGMFLAYARDLVGCAGFGAAFLLVFALRMRTELRGEALSDRANAVPRAKPSPAALPSVAPRVVVGQARGGVLSSSFGALLGKEFVYLRRNVGLLYGLIAPVFLMFVLAYRWGASSTSPWVLPGAIAYALVGIAPLSYNSFGLDAAGAQFYFMAPVPLRQVFVAKNVLHFLLALAEVCVAIVVICFISAVPSLLLIVSCVLWAAGALLLNTAVGNHRSVSAPRRIEAARTAGKQASPTSSLISLGVLLACVAFGGSVLTGAEWIGARWVSLPVFGVMAGLGFLVYRRSLVSAESHALQQREVLLEVLARR